MKSLNLIVFLKSIWSHCFLVATCCSAPFMFIFVLIKVKNMWRRWGTSQNFFIAFTDELEKQIFKYLLKKLLKWASKKNKIILIFTILHSFLKIKKTPGDIIILYHVPKILMIWSTVPETGKQRNRMKYIILGVFCSFHRAPPPLPLTLKTKKIKILKWWKFLEISSCYACVPKITIIRCMVSEVQSETDRFFFFVISDDSENKNF